MPSRVPRVTRTEAVVLRHRRLGEADRIVTLLTPFRGKVDAVAKGALRPRSKIGGHLEPMTQVEVLLAHGARRVHAVDVGHGQLHARLRDDPRVDGREHTDIRTLTATDFAEQPDIVVVVGVGGIGINSVQGAAAAGARAIVAVDPVEFKREKAKEFGATHTCSSMDEAMALVGEISWGRMADLVILTMGVVEGKDLLPGLLLTGKGRRCVVVGLGDMMAVDAANNMSGGMMNDSMMTTNSTSGGMMSNNMMSNNMMMNNMSDMSTNTMSMNTTTTTTNAM